MEGGMRLSLTTEEEEARRRVQLPYEHQGKVGCGAGSCCPFFVADNGRVQQCMCAVGRKMTPTSPPDACVLVMPMRCLPQGAAYQTGDWRDYLPPEAGGRGAAGGGSGRRLGHILYVRDSGSEHDSDEDPDDDLDL